MARLTTEELLRAYRQDAPFLFLSSAFITVAVVAAAFCLVRRRWDPLLVWLAMFAFLYGERLRLVLAMVELSHEHSELFLRLRSAINYLVPVPAFGFFSAAGLLGHWRRPVAVGLSGIFLALVAATLVTGARSQLDLANSVTLLIALPVIMFGSQIWRGRDVDARAIRVGLLCFVGTALADNAAVAMNNLLRIEPYGFAVFLGCLGYVAARRRVQQDAELVEIRNELELARRMQLAILPERFPESPAFKVAARYVPMSSVAGDFYDFLGVGEGRAGILIADVSGHGVPAALIASMVKMAASSGREDAAEPGRLLEGMNRALCGNTQGQFVTAAYVYLDAEAGEMRYAAAGHPAMLLLRGGEVREVIENGLMLGITETAGYGQVALPMLEGDRLILYTDGLLEARDRRGELFGEERFFGLVRETAGLAAAGAVERMIAAVEGWVAVREDDLTVIVCDVVETGPGRVLANGKPSLA